jgi:hypothetical protein
MNKKRRKYLTEKKREQKSHCTIRLTRGGPPRKMVPCLRTMMLSSAMAGIYAPPAVQLPNTTAICTTQHLYRGVDKFFKTLASLASS